MTAEKNEYNSKVKYLIRRKERIEGYIIDLKIDKLSNDISTIGKEIKNLRSNEELIKCQNKRHKYMNMLLISFSIATIFLGPLFVVSHVINMPMFINIIIELIGDISLVMAATSFVISRQTELTMRPTLQTIYMLQDNEESKKREMGLVEKKTAALCLLLDKNNQEINKVMLKSLLETNQINSNTDKLQPDDISRLDNEDSKNGKRLSFVKEHPYKGRYKI